MVMEGKRYSLGTAFILGMAKANGSVKILWDVAAINRAA